MLKRYLFAITIIILVVSGCSQKGSDENKQEVIAARLVKTMPVQQKDVMEYLSYSGVLEAEQAVNITPAISAEVKEIFVQEGDIVEQGFLLARLDDTELQQATLQFEMLNKNYQKMSNLYQAGSIDEGSYDDAATAYNSAKEAYEFLLENTEITAPFSGVITSVSVKENEIFNSMTMSYLVRLVDLSNIKGNVYVSETDLGKLNIGNIVYFNTDADPKRMYQGKLTFISPEADAYSGTYICQFVTSNPDNSLKHNQFCRAKLVTAISTNTLAIPPTALIDENIVMTNDNGYAKAIVVETGLENEFEVEIISGLRGDEEIIYVGHLGLKEGNKLQINQ